MMAMTSPRDRNFQLHYNLMGPLSYMQSVVDPTIVTLHRIVAKEDVENINNSGKHRKAA